VGTLLTLFFRSSPPLDARAALESDRAAYARFFGAMLDRGAFLPPSQFEAWFTSLAHTADDVAFTIEAARASLAEVT
jgi:glutamate-1-semialdehyde 2,1-aminomutase